MKLTFFGELVVLLFTECWRVIPSFVLSVEITVFDLLNSAFSNGRREAEISNKLFVNEVAYNKGNIKIWVIISLNGKFSFLALKIQVWKASNCIRRHVNSNLRHVWCITSLNIIITSRFNAIILWVTLERESTKERICLHNLSVIKCFITFMNAKILW